MMEKIIFTRKFEDQIQNISARKPFIVADSNVSRYYLKRLLAVFPENCPYYLLESGEQNKTRNQKRKIEDYMLENEYGRDSILIALGGGVVSDIAGFIASTYNRGIPLINIPTSLLAMVDAAIGGKNGVNTWQGKNLIGTFWTAESVIIDFSLLDTLPDEEFLNGFAEIVKIAIIRDKRLFDNIEENIDEIRSRNKTTIERLIKRSIELKMEIVKEDQFENGIRQILNFGHTIGHAIEKRDDVPHGLAVSMGMVKEAQLSIEMGLLKKDDLSRITTVLKKLGLPIKTNYDGLTDYLKMDKKSKNNKPRFIAIEKLGQVYIQEGVYSQPLL